MAKPPVRSRPDTIEQRNAYEAAGVVHLQRAWRGWRSPYTEAYRDAAEELHDRARATKALHRIGLPALFLARHSLELVLKQLVHEVLRVINYEHQLAQFECNRAPLYARFTKDELKPLRKHSLRKLLSLASDALQRVGIDDPLKATDVAVDAFSRADDDCDTFFRFETTRDGKNVLAKDAEIRVSEIMAHFQRAWDECARDDYREPSGPATTVLGRVWELANELEQCLYPHWYPELER